VRIALECGLQSDPTSFFPTALDSRHDLKSVEEMATHLAVKLAAVTANFTTQWMADRLKLPHRIVDEILWELRDEKLLEVLGQVGPLTYRYRITQAGLDFSSRLMDLCGYLGPTPVSLDDYQISVDKQRSVRQSVTPEDVAKATAQLTIPAEIREIAALAISSNRSLFIFGPPGNGKSSLGRLLHNAVEHPIWIPFAIAIDNQVIRLYDPEYHSLLPEHEGTEHDPRWVQIKQPFVISGGELTLEQLDLVFDRSVNFYEAPPHLKANCGTYFIDDFGRQRIPPMDLLNRWIVPLEHQIDYLSLVNGKKIDVPFQMMLIVATNLETSDVSDAAFLRRMGYRIHLQNPSEEDYRTIFLGQAAAQNLELADGVLDLVIQQYKSENRPWRGSEPRDLLVRCSDVIFLHKLPARVDQRVFQIAWRGYFSNENVR
jgi:predicted ATPase with chaperone activity